MPRCDGQKSHEISDDSAVRGRDLVTGSRCVVEGAPDWHRACGQTVNDALPIAKALEWHASPNLRKARGRANGASAGWRPTVALIADSGSNRCDERSRPAGCRNSPRSRPQFAPSGSTAALAGARAMEGRIGAQGLHHPLHGIHPVGGVSAAGEASRRPAQRGLDPRHGVEARRAGAAHQPRDRGMVDAGADGEMPKAPLPHLQLVSEVVAECLCG